MREQKAFDLGAAAGFFLALAGFSGNWLITPMSHPDASALQRAGVIAQGLICLGIALFLFVRRRQRVSSSPAV
jgi:uncharacterized membrane protein